MLHYKISTTAFYWLDFSMFRLYECMLNFFSAEDLVLYHKLVSWLCNIVGIPFLASAVVAHNGHANAGSLLAIESVFFLCIYKLIPTGIKNIGNAILSPISVVAMTGSSAYVGNLYGCYTAVMLILSGILIGTEGVLLGVPRVDIFHYGLVIANMLYVAAMRV